MNTSSELNTTGSTAESSTGNPQNPGTPSLLSPAGNLQNASSFTSSQSLNTSGSGRGILLGAPTGTAKIGTTNTKTHTTPYLVGIGLTIIIVGVLLVIITSMRFNRRFASIQ